MMSNNSISDYVNKIDKKVGTYFSSGKLLRRIITNDFLPRIRDLLERLGSHIACRVLDTNT